MVQLRHIGLYVSNLETQTDFYRRVFGMHFICESVEQQDQLISALIAPEAKVKITKLITDQGKASGIGDMLELIYYCNGIDDGYHFENVYKCGCMHLGFSVENILVCLSKIKELGVKQCTDIILMHNGNKCCFARDPEGNWLELIESRI